MRTWNHLHVTLAMPSLATKVYILILYFFTLFAFYCARVHCADVIGNNIEGNLKIRVVQKEYRFRKCLFFGRIFFSFHAMN